MRIISSLSLDILNTTTKEVINEVFEVPHRLYGASRGPGLPGFSTASRVLAQPSTGLPPLIDRELFFGDPEISGAQISPDGKFIAFIKPFKGTRNIWVKQTAEPFDAAKPITADTKRPITEYFWSRDGKYILFVQDKAGDENYNVYAVNPADSAGRRTRRAGRAKSHRREGRARRNLCACRAASPTRSTSV